MLFNNYLPLPIRFYDDESRQYHRSRRCCNECKVPLLTPQEYIIPFQLVVPGAATTLVSARAQYYSRDYSTVAGQYEMLDITEFTSTTLGDCTYFTYNSHTPVIDRDCVPFVLELEFSNGLMRYSDFMMAIEDICCKHTLIRYRNSCTVDGIQYDDPNLWFEMWLDAPITELEHKSKLKSQSRSNLSKLREHRYTERKYVLETLPLPDYQAAALYAIANHDRIILSHNYNTLPEVQHLEYKGKLTEGECFESIKISAVPKEQTFSSSCCDNDGLVLSEPHLYGDCPVSCDETFNIVMTEESALCAEVELTACSELTADVGYIFYEILGLGDAGHNWAAGTDINDLTEVYTNNSTAQFLIPISTSYYVKYSALVGGEQVSVTYEFNISDCNTGPSIVEQDCLRCFSVRTTGNNSPLYAEQFCIDKGDGFETLEGNTFCVRGTDNFAIKATQIYNNGCPDVSVTETKNELCPCHTEILALRDYDLSGIPVVGTTAPGVYYVELPLTNAADESSIDTFLANCNGEFAELRISGAGGSPANGTFSLYTPNITGTSFPGGAGVNAIRIGYQLADPVSDTPCADLINAFIAAGNNNLQDVEQNGFTPPPTAPITLRLTCYDVVPDC